MFVLRTSTIGLVLLFAISGCASDHVIVSGSNSISYEHKVDELSKIGKLATEHCASLGKETKLESTTCPNNKLCVSIFSCNSK